MTHPTRLSALLAVLGWSQKTAAQTLGCSQPTVCRVAGGQREPGPLAALLDRIAIERGLPYLTADAWAQARQGDAAVVDHSDSTQTNEVAP